MNLSVNKDTTNAHMSHTGYELDSIADKWLFS